MDLKTYFKTNRQVDLARKIGVTSGAVNQWAGGLTAITAERCIQIEQATNGQVRCEDLRPDVAWSVLRANAALTSATPVAAETVVTQGD